MAFDLRLSGVGPASTLGASGLPGLDPPAAGLSGVEARTATGFPDFHSYFDW